jgi:hypothetical protein
MLWMFPHPEGGSVVGETLRRDPQEDAELLCDLHASYPKFSELCLSGRLGDLSGSLKLPTPPTFGKVVGMMLVYYAKLESQLIALRQWAINRYQVSIGQIVETGTLGRHANDIGDMFTGLNRAEREVKSGRPGRGVYSAGVIKTEPVAERVLKRIRQSGPGMTDGLLKRRNREFFEASDATRLEGEASFEAVYAKLKNDGLGGTQPLRQLSLSTVEMATAGHQRAFALMRLLALADGAERAIGEPGTLGEIDWRRCFGDWPRQRDVRFGPLWVVHRRLVYQDRNFFPPVKSDGSPAEIRAQLEISARKEQVIGEETVKDLVHKKIEWSNRPSAATTPHLQGSAKWDVLPCFRLSPSRSDHPWEFEPLPTPMDQLWIAAAQQGAPASPATSTPKSGRKKSKRKAAGRSPKSKTRSKNRRVSPTPSASRSSGGPPPPTP